MARMDEDEFERALDGAINEAASWQQSTLSEDRQRNYRYYAGKMKPAPAGRSQAVSWDVFETVESAMPDLVEMFLAADNIAEFEPVGEEDEQMARQATDYINYIVQKQNPGFLIFANWIKDALLSKVGVVRAYWAKSTRIIDKEYSGLNEDQLTMLVEDDEVEIVERESYDDPMDKQARDQARQVLNTLDPMVRAQVEQELDRPAAKLYDVKIRRTREAGRIYIDNVQPENFIVSPRAKTLDDADLVGELKAMSRSEMREAGFKKSDIEEAQNYDVILDQDGLAAELDDDTWTDPFWSSAPDEATEDVIVFDGFVRLDYDGDGRAEWRHVVRAGNVTLLNEQAEGPDFVCMSPILIPHRLIGMSLADTVAPLQEMSTAMMRQYVDSLVLANNPRTYALEGQVNLDDLLNPRVGGVVRVKQPGAVGPLQTSVVADSALQGIEFMDSRREIRTGITRYNQGLDADSLNKTATGVSKIMSAGDRRKLMMARIMAETGIKQLFRLILRLVVENQDAESRIRLHGQWQSIDPSPWSPDMDVNTEIGQGTGDKSQLIGVLQMVLEAQKEAMANGLPLVGMENLYATMESIMRAAGVRHIGKYFKDPADLPPQQPEEPKPTPEEVVAQATVEAERIRAQARIQEAQLNLQVKQADLQMKQIELQIKQAELQLKAQEAGVKLDLESTKVQTQATKAQADIIRDQRREDREDARLITTPIGS